MADDAPPEPEYTKESWWAPRRAFLKLWPGVDSERIHMVLRRASDLGTRGIQEIIAAALDAGGSEAADLLMAPVAATFPFPDYRDRAGTVVALDALIRAGGDPTPALPALVQALSDHHCRESAVRTLRRAALAGWSLDGVRADLEAMDDSRGDLATVCRLAFSAHPDRADRVAVLKEVYGSQPMGNLRKGIGLVEDLLEADLPDVWALGDEVLVELRAAGRDAYAMWHALLPALRHMLESGSVAQRADALHIVSQFRYVPKYALGMTEEAAQVAAKSTLERCLEDVAPLLGDPNARVARAAADAVKVLVGCGASIEGVRKAVDTALDHAHVGVRSLCSMALSHHLRRSGEEPELPGGAWYRRTYARTDEPVCDEAPRRCGVCGAEASRTIYDEDDGSQFYRLYTSETHCTACGRYVPHVFRAPG